MAICSAMASSSLSFVADGSGCLTSVAVAASMTASVLICLHIWEYFQTGLGIPSVMTSEFPPLFTSQGSRFFKHIWKVFQMTPRCIQDWPTKMPTKYSGIHPNSFWKSLVATLGTPPRQPEYFHRSLANVEQIRKSTKHVQTKLNVCMDAASKSMNYSLTHRYLWIIHDWSIDVSDHSWIIYGYFIQYPWKMGKGLRVLLRGRIMRYSLIKKMCAILKNMRTRDKYENKKGARRKW